MYDENNNLNCDFEKRCNHQGLYSFIIQNGNIKSIAYVGKGENNNRIRINLTGKNLNGKRLADYVNTKHQNILVAIENGYSVFISLYANSSFNKASLSCLEIATAVKSKESFLTVFSDLDHWNKPIG